MANRLALSAVALAMGSIIAVPVQAAVLTVNSTLDDTTASNGLCTLREAIVSVNTGVRNDDCSANDPGVNDQIVFGGTITTSSVITLDRVLNINSNVSIEAPFDGINRVTVDQSGASGVFSINNSGAISKPHVSMSNLNIVGGDASYGGGGFFMQSASLELNNCSVTGNSAGLYGGGISLENSELTLNSSRVTANNSGGYGGGIDSYDNSNVTLVDSLVFGNTAVTRGGGIALKDSVLNATNVTINTNRSGTDGGGIYAISSTANISGNSSFISSRSTNNGGAIALVNSSMSLTGADIAGGSASGFGGAINVQNSQLQISKSGIAFNSATVYHGGAVAVRGASSSVTINRSAIHSNSATTFGGGIYLADGEMQISDVLIRNNKSDSKGGGVMVNNGGSLTITNATVVFNTAMNNGGGINLYGAGNSYGRIANSIISNNSATGDGDEIALEFSPQVANFGFNVLGHSGVSTVDAIQAFVPSLSDVIATSDGGSSTDFNDILGPIALVGNQLIYPLVDGSPAIGLADAGQCGNLDQTNFDRGLTFLFPIKASNGNTTVIDLGTNVCDSGSVAYQPGKEYPPVVSKLAD